jgi:hypothetical protein
VSLSAKKNRREPLRPQNQENHEKGKRIPPKKSVCDENSRMSDTFPNAHFSRFRTRRQQPSTFDGEHKHTPFTTRKFISHGNRVHESVLRESLR